MENDPAQEWQRMQGVYSQMSEDELRNVADTGYDLTDIARQVLQAEISARKLDIPLAMQAPIVVEEEPMGDARFDPEEFELIDVHMAWDEEEARKAKEILDNSRIPSFFGPKNLESIDEFKGSYERGVKLKVPEQFADMARLAFQSHWPKDDAEEEIAEADIRCPKCRSDEVVLVSVDEAEDESVDSKFNWHCDGCGNAWQDDGVGKA
jgi:DNA-directed RNA polymerase subunit M/transcription elongation factor TFIIS